MCEKLQYYISAHENDSVNESTVFICLARGEKKLFFMLISAEHKILNTNRYKNIKKFSFF